MGGSYRLLLLVGVFSLLSIISCGNCPRDGRPGVNGGPGRDGRPGLRGQKGEPALEGNSVPLSLQKLKGDAGPRGAQGPMGPKGYGGHLGQPGKPGPSGEPGVRGKYMGQAAAAVHKHSTFSVTRDSDSYPTYGQVVMFEKFVVNEHADFSLQSGRFTCSIPGVYYFTFSSKAKVTMCLSINSNALDINDGVAFCDSNRNFDQVLTGGVVLQLKVGDQVWLKSVRDFQGNTDLQDKKAKQIIFSGFLLF